MGRYPEPGYRPISVLSGGAYLPLAASLSLLPAETFTL